MILQVRMSKVKVILCLVRACFLLLVVGFVTSLQGRSRQASSLAYFIKDLIYFKLQIPLFESFPTAHGLTPSGWGLGFAYGLNSTVTESLKPSVPSPLPETQTYLI